MQCTINHVNFVNRYILGTCKSGKAKEASCQESSTMNIKVSKNVNKNEDSRGKLRAGRKASTPFHFVVVSMTGGRARGGINRRNGKHNSTIASDKIGALLMLHHRRSIRSGG